VGGAILLRARAAGAAARLAQALFVLTSLVGLAALAGFLYGAADVHGAMSLNSAVGFLLLGIAGLCARPAEGLVGLMRTPGPGGALARTAVPIVILLPFVLGGLGLLGQHAGLFGAETGTALLVVSLIAMLVLSTARGASSVERAEAAVRASLAETRAAEERS